MFSERLRITLTVQATGGDPFTIPGASVRAVDLHARTHGFEAKVSFVISSEQEPDPLFDTFVARDLLTASISLATLEEPLGDEEPDPLQASGLVTDKWVKETVAPGVTGAPVVLRLYTIAFRDPAQVLWRQHFPSDLWSNEKLETVIDAYKVGGLTIDYALGALGQTRGIIFVGLGGPDDRDASFYDFLMWFLDRQAASFELDYPTGKYKITQDKTVDSTPEPVANEDIAMAEVLFPATRRESGQILNAYSESPDKVAITRAQAVTGVRRDTLVRTPIAADVERRGAIETSRLKDHDEGLRLVFSHFPRTTFRPHKLVTFGEGWSDNLRTNGKKYRVLELHLTGEATAESLPLDIDFTEETVVLKLDVGARLELSTSPVPFLPPFTPPTYPSYVEGKVVSVGGGTSDRTWLTVEDEATSISFQQVDVPLWNKKILVPFTPGLSPGHFFFPPYKNQRVLLALDFDKAAIVRYLDWAANARLPGESQGNQLVLGKQAKDGVTIAHTYVDAKPKLLVTRTFGNDLQTVEMSDGLVKIVVEEKVGELATEPTFDVTMQVEAAKGQLSVQVQGGIDDLTGQFETSMGGLNSEITGAAAEVESSLANMEVTLLGKIEAAKGELEALASSLESAVGGLGAKVSAAKGEILAALTG